MARLIGLREKLQETPMIFMGKSMVSGLDFPLSQAIEWLVRGPVLIDNYEELLKGNYTNI